MRFGKLTVLTDGYLDHFILDERPQAALVTSAPSSRHLDKPQADQRLVSTPTRSYRGISCISRSSP